MTDTRFFERLTPENAALVMIDHHTGLIATMRTIDPIRLVQNSVALARIAKAFNLPVVISGEPPYGTWGQVLPEIKAVFPDAPIYHRSAVDAFEDEAVRKAIEATGRKKLIMAGVSSDVCLIYPALSAIAAGYDVYGVMDASGSWDTLAEQAAMHRMAQGGVKLTHWVGVAAELQRDWARPSAGLVQEVYADVPAIKALLTNLPR